MAGFDVLGAIDRFGWDMIEPTAAGAVTDQIRRAAAVLAMPLRHRATVAEQLTNLDRLTPGRLTLGVPLRGRPDDYGQRVRMDPPRAADGRGPRLAQQGRPIW